MIPVIIIYQNDPFAWDTLDEVGDNMSHYCYHGVMYRTTVYVRLQSLCCF